MANSTKKRMSCQKGGTMAEYAAIVFLIILAVIGVFMLLGVSIGDLVEPVVDIF